MTTENMPKRAPGVHSRPGSSVWQWKIRAPDELRSLYSSEWAHRCSLKTRDLSVANLLAATLQAQWLARFDEQRKALNPQRVELVTPAMAKLLAERVRASVLGMDDTLRREPQVAREIVNLMRVERANGLAIGNYTPSDVLGEAPPLDPIDGMPLPLLLELADMNEAGNQDAAMQMAMQRVAAVLPLVETEAASLGLLFDRKAPGAMEALRECLKAYRTAWQDVAERDSGAVIEK